MERGGIHTIDYIRIIDKWVEIYLEGHGENFICSKYGNLLTAIENANLYEHVLNNGINGIKIEIKNKHIKRIFKVRYEEVLEIVKICCFNCGKQLNTEVWKDKERSQKIVECCGALYNVHKFNFPSEIDGKIYYPSEIVMKEIEE